MLELNPSAFLPDLDEVLSTTGKKSMAVDPAFEPLIGNNHLRTGLKRIPGVMLAEEDIQGVHLNLGARGLSPLNGVSLQVLQDGFPLNVDVFGNRMVGSFPDLNQVSQIQFIAGPSSLLSGAYPGGVLRLQSYPAVGDRPFLFKNLLTFGSHGYVSDLAESGGTIEDFSYSIFGRYARGDGFKNQPDFEDARAGFRVVQRIMDHTSLELGYQVYDFDSDALGGLALATGGVNNALNYYYQSSIRHLVQGRIFHEFDPSSRIQSLVWYHYTQGQRNFPETPIPILGRTTEAFHYIGTDHRWVREYGFGPTTGNLLTLGATVQGAISPLESRPTRAGEVRLDLDRHDFNAALFAENKFQLSDRWSIAPAFRVEYAELEGSGVRGDGAADNNARVDREFDDTVFLPSLASELDLIAPRGLKERPLVLYAQAGLGYRPPTYNETINLGAATRVPGGLRSSRIFHLQSGLKGNPRSWITYDLSAFHMTYQDQFAVEGGRVRNTGRTRHRGIEGFLEFDLFELSALFSNDSADPDSNRNHRLFYFNALTFLEAEVRSSPFAGAEGGEIPYAPEWIWKTGLSYNFRERLKLAVFLQSVSDHLGNLANDQGLLRNNRTAEVPGYTTLDFSGEYRMWKDRLAIFLNLHNLTDEQYFAVLQGGTGAANQIQSPGRTVYGGIRLTF